MCHIYLGLFVGGLGIKGSVKDPGHDPKGRCNLICGQNLGDKEENSRLGIKMC